MTKPAVVLTMEQRETAGRVIVSECAKRQLELIALAVLGQHVHGLAKMPVDDKKKRLGLIKARSSFALRAEIPGAVWEKRADFRRVRSLDHQREGFRYIVEHEREGA